MDFGGNERRRTKKDLKRKRLARGYKRGGQFRTQEVNESQSEESTVSAKGPLKDNGKKKGRKKKT